MDSLPTRGGPNLTILSFIIVVNCGGIAGKVSIATNQQELNFRKTDFQNDKSRIKYGLNDKIMEFINDRNTLGLRPNRKYPLWVLIE